MFDDFLLQHIRWGQIVEVVLTVILEPEDVEAGLSSELLSHCERAYRPPFIARGR
jgi:hypothetical protein